MSKYRENPKIVVHCPCPQNEKLTRKTDRVALANLQGEAERKKGSLKNGGPTTQSSTSTETGAKLQRCTTSSSSTTGSSKRSSSRPTITKEDTNSATRSATSTETGAIPQRCTTSSSSTTGSSKRSFSRPTIAKEDTNSAICPPRASTRQAYLSPFLPLKGPVAESSRIDDDNKHIDAKYKIRSKSKSTATRAKPQSCASSQSTTGSSAKIQSSKRSSSRPRITKDDTNRALHPKHAETKVMPTKRTRAVSERKSSASSDIDSYVYDGQINFKDKIASSRQDLGVPGNTASMQIPRNNVIPSSSGQASKGRNSIQEAMTLPRDQFYSLTEPSSSDTVDFSLEATATIPSIIQRFSLCVPEDLKGSEVSPTAEALYKCTEKGFVCYLRDSSKVCAENVSREETEKFFGDFDKAINEIFETEPIRSPLEMPPPFIRTAGSQQSGKIQGGMLSCKQLLVCKKPAVKKSLQKSNKKTQIDCTLLYSTTYCEDIIEYCYQLKNKFMPAAKCVTIYIDKRERTNVLNWLLQVAQFIKIPHESIFFMAVRIFDFSLVNMKLRQTSYYLAAIVALWISEKYFFDGGTLMVSKIFSLANGKYSKQEILSMELEILKSTQYCLNMADPIDFLYYYLKSANLQNDKRLVYSARFVLECATLFDTYSMIEAPFMVACAVFLAYQVVRESEHVPINFKWYKVSDLQMFVENILNNNVTHVIMKKYEPLLSYKENDKLQVAKLFYGI